MTTRTQTDQKVIKGILIKTSGHIEDVELSGSDSEHVDQLRKMVSTDDTTPDERGYFEILPVPSQCETQVFVNDCGRLNNMAINMPATIWLTGTGRYSGFVCGPVVVFGNGSDPGETGDVPEQVRFEIPDFRSEDFTFPSHTVVEEHPKGT